MADNSDRNFLDMLRQRTEEEELKHYLKTTVGGYTKSSVMEYLSELRKRQQSSSETFNLNMQTLLEEKENLKSENEKLLMQISQAKTDFLRLAESRKQQQQQQQEAGQAEPTNDNIVYLKNTVPTPETPSMHPHVNTLEIESEKQKFDEMEAELKNEIAVLKQEISEKDAELEKSKQDISEQKELLAFEKLESKKQRDLVSEISVAAEELQEEFQYMKERFSEDKLQKLNEYIAELTGSLEQQGVVISQLKAQAADKDNKIKTLLDENVAIMKNMELMSNSLDVMTVQNEKLLTANTALAQAFEDENKKVVNLINKISEETVEKLILERKLEETAKNSSPEINTNQSAKNEAPEGAESRISIA